ncbi:hypothetical protein HMPREF2559_06045 [Corynebacterium sp. HMSC072G08]|uniref:AMIN-like domain-containing (lipo)protein n=1 Tax=Corynebacterium sp. HMSC072G08 TaxID=1715039 RepID=UPI0008A489AF|nr:hypothetical protein [Corynebacterium sp. HMSC072G08]OFN39609.1 hypothetical protein HMPREF2559_06045 [Corynebacterium sp. HMSC072G08]
MSTTRHFRYSALLALPLIVAGCSSTEPSDAPASPLAATSSSGTTSAATSSTESSALASSPESPTTSTDPEDTAGSAPAGFLGTPSLADQPLTQAEGAELVPVAVRVGSHEGYDRVVIEFTGPGKPGWYTQYTNSPAAQASGKPVAYDGATALVLGIEGTPWPSTPQLQQQYAEFTTYPGAGAVTGVNFVNAFEAQSQFVIGLDRQLPYSVTFLEGPPRVVVDFQTS